MLRLVVSSSLGLISATSGTCVAFLAIYVVAGEVRDPETGWLNCRSEDGVLAK